MTTTLDYAGLIERLRKPGTWARHGDDIIASDAKEELVRDDAPFEAATAIRTLLERNEALERERDELKHDVSRYIEIASDEATLAEISEAKLAEARKALERVPDEAGHWAYVHCRVHIGSEHEDELSEFVTQKVRSFVEGVLAQNRETEWEREVHS